MKNLIFTIILIVTVPTLIFSQNKQFKKLFKEYENISGFDISIGTSDSDFNLDTDNDIFELINNIKDIYILNYEGNKRGNKFEDFKAKFDKIISKNHYKPMIDISSDGSFRVLIKKDSKDVATGIVLINENEKGAVYMVAVK